MNYQPILDTPSQPNIAFIINPNSGSGTQDPSDTILTLARSLGWSGHDYRTTLEADATQMAKKAIADGATRLVVCGGDGTLMEVAQAVAKTGIELAVVPLGTGNLLALNLDLPMNVEEAVRLALSGTPAIIDCGLANGTYFLINAGIGLDAQIMAHTSSESKEKLGALAYVLSAVKSARGRSSKFSITVDGQKASYHRAKSVFVANMGKIQAGIPIIREAREDNGQLSVAVIEASSPLEWLSLIFNMIRRRPHKSTGYWTVTGKDIIVSVHGKALPYQCDGNDFPSTTCLHTEAIPEGIVVIR